MPPQWHPWGIYMWNEMNILDVYLTRRQWDGLAKSRGAGAPLLLNLGDLSEGDLCGDGGLGGGNAGGGHFRRLPGTTTTPSAFLPFSLPPSKLQWAIPFLHAASRILWRQRARACHSHSPRFVWIEEGERERDEALTRGWNPNPWLKSPAVSASPPQDPWPRSVHRWPSILAVPFPPVVRTGWGRMDGSDWLGIHRTAGGDGMPAWGRNTHGLDRLAVSGSNPLYPNWEVKTVVGTRPGL